MEKVAPNLYGIWIDEYTNKCLLAEFETFVALIEFPQNDSITIDLIKLIMQNFPNKPLKFVFHSHHHAHSISSFDNFLRHTKATLITTPFNFNEIKNRTIDTSNLLQRSVIFDSIYKVMDGLNELQVLEVSQKAYNIPTPEYNIFYFPKQKFLVSGCLFNKPLTYFEVINARKPALKKIINDRKLKVEILFPTNTSSKGGFEDLCTIETLDSALVKGINPYDFIRDFQLQPLDYLESKKDSLAIEFSKIPRSFDYIVCANGLISIKKDYSRALIILKVLLTIYKTEYTLYVNIADTYAAKGDKIEAIAFYHQYLQFATDKDDINEINRQIKKLEE